MKSNKLITLLIVSILIMVACQPASDLEALTAKKSKLKAELAEIENQIRATDTVQNEFLPLVITDSIKLGTFEHRVNLQGAVKTDHEIMINAEANGVLLSVDVREGQFVKKGQKLAELDSEILSSNAQELETALEFAEYSYEKQLALFEKGVGTEFELKQAKNQLNSLKSQISTLKTQKSKYIVRAPFDGYIDEIMVRKGEMAGAQSPLMRLVNNKEMRLTADISEYYYTKIAVGTPLNAYIPTLNKNLDLKVTSVGSYIHPTNRTFKIQADVSQENDLIPNMLAEISVVDATLDSVYIIPAKALVKSQNNEDFIFVVNTNDLKNPKVEYLEIEVLSRYEGKAAISVGDFHEDLSNFIVIVEGARGVTNGDQVRIQ